MLTKCFAVAALCVGVVAVCRADPAGTITHVTGRVEIEGVDGVRRPAHVGDPVQPGETVRTRTDGAADIALPDQSTVRVGPRGALTPGDIVAIGKKPYEPGLLRSIFKWIGGVISSTAPEKVKVRMGTGAGGGIRGDAGKAGPDFYASVADDGAGLVVEVSVLSGALKVDGVDYALLPDRYFVDPLVKSFDGLDSAAVLADVTPERDVVDVLGLGSPVDVDAGQWTRISGSGPPLTPQLGLAASHVNAEAELNVPEPAALALALVALALRGGGVRCGVASGCGVAAGGRLEAGG